MQTRKYLVGIAVGIVPFQGCSGLLGPDPEITDTAASQSFSGALTGSGEIVVALVNGGRSGDVEIGIVFEDGDGAVVGLESHTITMDEDEQRREIISVDVSDSVERYRAEAGAA